MKKSILKNKKRSGRLAPVIAACFVAVALAGCNNANSNKTEEESVAVDINSDKTLEDMAEQNAIPVVYSITEESNPMKMGNAPISSYWFPEELLAWNPEQDPDASYNKSVVPLASRISKDASKTVNTTQNQDTKLVSISIMNQNTSGNPSQGTSVFDSNTFSYYQYIDTLVYWGGSAGEGIIVPPSPDVVDSAHRNGVPVLGTVFFPQTAHGGKMEWLNKALEKDENGDFPFAEKLVEVALTYGFDGWFINQETEGTESEPLTKEHSALIKEFLLNLKKYHSGNLHIMWYDSQTSEGKMDWQNTLNGKNEMFLFDKETSEFVSDSMFLNFWWYYKDYFEQDLLKKAKEHAEELGISPYELYAGIDVQANGTEQPVRWNILEESENSTYTSIGLYCPSWTFFSSSDSDEFQEKENRFWVNENGNPAVGTKATDMEWRGISTYIAERSPVSTLPFYTNFNIGNGYNYFIDGEKVSSLDWNNRSLADIMPTYRWIIENEGKNKVVAGLDYANAYYGGNSIKFTADLEAGKASKVNLFRTDLKLEENTKFTVAARADAEISLGLILELEDGTVKEIDGDKKLSSQWQEIEYDIKDLKDSVVRNISFDIISEKDVNFTIINLGNISVYNDVPAEVIAVDGLTVENTAFEEEDTLAGVRLSWKEISSPDLKVYEVYRINEDESRSFLGASANNCIFINALQRVKGVGETTFEVIAVNKDNIRGIGATASITWPDNSIPKAKFVANRTIAAPGQEVSFTNKSNAVTESVRWDFTGADVETSTEENPVVTYSKEGEYTVKITAINEKGENEFVLENLITITKDAEKGLVNLSAGKGTEASSFVNDAEAPPYAVDGDSSTKWCAVGPDQHNITIDLGAVKSVGEVKILHAQAGGESDGMNTEEYRIEVSEDGESYTTVAEVIKNSVGETIDAFKMVKARYVKLTVLKATQGDDSAARIYEVEVYGLD